jgi:hypothetical protein
MRLNIEKARDQGVHIAYLSGNTGYYQVQLAPNSKGVPNRLIYDAKLDYDSSPYCPDDSLLGISNLTDSQRYPWPDVGCSFSCLGNYYTYARELALIGSCYVGVFPAGRQRNTFGAPFTVSESTHFLYKGTGLTKKSSIKNIGG